MKLNKIMLSVALVMGMATAAQAASTGKLTITGSITSTACTINTGDENKIVDLGSINKADFTTDGAPVGNYGFSLGLNGCAKNADVRVRFMGPVDPATPKLLKTTGTATGVGIGLFEPDGTTPIDINTNTKPQKTDASGNAQLYYQAAYVAPAVGSVGEGSADANATFIIINN